METTSMKKIAVIPMNTGFEAKKVLNGFFVIELKISFENNKRKELQAHYRTAILELETDK